MAKILWIEDEARDQLIEYVSPLIRNGHTIDIEEDASNAYNRLKEKQYDVIIFDLLIKSGADFDMDDKYMGLALLKKIFIEDKNKINLDINKILIFTVVTDNKIIQQLKDLGIKSERIKVKERMEKTRLKTLVDEILRTIK